MKSLPRVARLLALAAMVTGCKRPPVPAPHTPVVPPRTTPLAAAMVRSACPHRLETPVQLGCSWLLRLPSGLRVDDASDDAWSAHLEDDCASPISEVSIRRVHTRRNLATRRYLEQAHVELERAHGPLRPTPQPRSPIPMVWLRTPSKHDRTTLLVSATRQREHVLVVTYHLDQEPDEAFASLLETSASSALRLPDAGPETGATGECSSSPSAGPRMHVAALAVVTWAAATNAARLMGAALEHVGLR